jgi:uncharacterized repeat protein (TIGR03803 family)
LYSFANKGDGGESYAGLILSGNTLYGTTSLGGEGTVFAVNTDGTGFKVLHSFGGTGDTTFPLAPLILSGNTLYGTTGLGGNGTVFKVNTDGTGYSILYRFTGGTDGARPQAGLILSGNTLYGTAFAGGSGYGTVFQVQTDGTGFNTLYSFTAGDDGAHPYGGLLLVGTTLFGTTQYGGSAGNDGVIFSISLPAGPPQLTITPSEANVILTWPTNAIGFALQSTTNLVSQVWTTNLPAPVMLNGQYTVTNPISGGQKFFRLSQP